MYESPDAPVLVCHQRKGIGFHHCFVNICLALHHRELPSGACQKAADTVLSLLILGLMERADPEVLLKARPARSAITSTQRTLLSLSN